MTKKITALSDYIPAGQAAGILSKKLGRRIRPDYVHQIKNVRSVKMNERCRLYHKADIQAATIKQRNPSSH